MNIAAIDFGTNSTRLLIASCCDKDGSVYVNPIECQANITQLGSTLHSNRLIQPESIDAATHCLSTYKKLIARHNVSHVFAVATSVFRDAHNGMEVKDQLERVIDSPISLLSGEDEARLMYAGITANRKIDQNTPVLCLDIGGGSCEVVHAINDKITNAISMQIGCLRTKKQFFYSDPPSTDEITAFIKHIQKNVPGSLINLLNNQPLFFAFGGTVTTLGLICKQISTDRLTTLEGMTLSKADIQTFLNSISMFTEQEIAKRYGKFLDKGRETVIRSGSIIFSSLMTLFKQQEAIMTNQGILFGIIRTHYNTLKH